MISKLLGRVFSGRLFKGGQPRIIPLAEHGIGRERIGNCALRTCEALQEAGHQAFVVGGAVRDLILGRDPKDFDVATDATPEVVRGIFRRSRIIGRRFRIVHVLCGRDLVEVTTFRGQAAEDEGNGQQVEDEHGRLLRDNVWGDQSQDAARRDFTINALFYDPAKQEVWDYHGGVADLRRRRLRMIGEPEQRYREDPVRMLRAVRFAASCGLEIDAASRVLIAPELREWAGIERDVMLVGMGTRFELWDKARYDAHEATVLAAGLPAGLRDLVL